jgi:hypothetical protein
VRRRQVGGSITRAVGKAYAVAPLAAAARDIAGEYDRQPASMTGERRIVMGDDEEAMYADEAQPSLCDP